MGTEGVERSVAMVDSWVFCKLDLLEDEHCANLGVIHMDDLSPEAAVAEHRGSGSVAGNSEAEAAADASS